MKTTKITTKLTAIGLLFAPFALSATVTPTEDPNTSTLTITNNTTTEAINTNSTGNTISVDYDVTKLVIGTSEAKSYLQFGAIGGVMFNSAALASDGIVDEVIVSSGSSLYIKGGNFSFGTFTVEEGATLSQVSQYSANNANALGGTLSGTINNYGTYSSSGIVTGSIINNYGTYSTSNVSNVAGSNISSTTINNYGTATLGTTTYTSVAINSIGDASTTIAAGTFSDSSFSGDITISGALTLSGTTSIYLDVNSTSDYESILFGDYATNNGTVALYLDFSDFTAVEGDVLDLSSLVDLYDDFSSYSAVYVDGVEVEDFDSDIILDNGYSLNLSNSSITVSGTAVPEPSTYAMIFGVVALGFAAYRRRK